MMKLQYIPPDIPPADTKRAQQLLAEMNYLVAQLTKWGIASNRDPKTRYPFLTPANRLELLGAGLARSVVANTAFYTQYVPSSQNVSSPGEDQLMVGFTFAAFDPELFSSPPIRKSLLQSHKGKCCYCESLINQSGSAKVDHFRPKSGYTDGSSMTVYRPGYYSLAYDPTNLLYSCSLCHEFKGDAFPVTGLRYPQATIEQETPILINPYLEDPRQYIRFNPLNARAYEFDLFQKFYFSQGLGPDDIQKLFWGRPEKIPLQNDIFGGPLSDDETNAAFNAWLSANKNSAPVRGQQTISILNLNRPGLVRARASQLLKLRGVRSISANHADPDYSAALALKLDLENLQSATAPLQAPEYLSASIDALSTWDASGGANTKFVQTYCNILKAVPAPAANPPSSPLPSNDAIIYLVFNQGRTIAGKRRVVYLSAADKVYSNPLGKHGVTVAIDWKNEINNDVIITAPNGQTRVSTLRSLLQEPPLQLARTFTEHEVWALGQYLPIDN